MEKKVDSICEENNLRKATFFEISTIAFQYFADENIDIAIIETGMGGRWDATNVVSPIVSNEITHIGIDHTEFLGKTLDKIAFEKAGIIKNNRPVISAPQDQVVRNILKSKGEKVFSNELITINKIRNSSKIKINTPSVDLPAIQFPLLGKHQLENASVAILVIDLISNSMNFEPNYKRGFRTSTMACRFSIISSNPIIILIQLIILMVQKL